MLRNEARVLALHTATPPTHTHTHPYVWDQLSSYANFWKTDQLKFKVAGFHIGYTNFNINLANKLGQIELTWWRLRPQLSFPFGASIAQSSEHRAPQSGPPVDEGSLIPRARNTLLSCLCLRSPSSHNPARLACNRSLFRLRPVFMYCENVSKESRRSWKDITEYRFPKNSSWMNSLKVWLSLQILRIPVVERYPLCVCPDELTALALGPIPLL